MVTDASASGVGGLISQGKDWHTTKIAAFYSAKLNSAQMNYPVHDLEFMAGIETMLRHKNLLMGMHFIWCTDHRALERLLMQPNLSGRQAHWLEKMADFDFEIGTLRDHLMYLQMHCHEYTRVICLVWCGGSQNSLR